MTANLSLEDLLTAFSCEPIYPLLGAASGKPLSPLSALQEEIFPPPTPFAQHSPNQPLSPAYAGFSPNFQLFSHRAPTATPPQRSPPPPYPNLCLPPITRPAPIRPAPPPYTSTQSSPPTVLPTFVTQQPLWRQPAPTIPPRHFAPRPVFYIPSAEDLKELTVMDLLPRPSVTIVPPVLMWSSFRDFRNFLLLAISYLSRYLHKMWIRV